MISVTLLSSYDYCQRKLFLERVLKLWVPMKDAMLKGTIRHEAYENINKIEEKIVTAVKKPEGYDKLFEDYKKEHAKILRESIIKRKSELKELGINLPELFKKTWPLVILESQERAINLANSIKKYKVVGKELWEKLTPKIESEMQLDVPDLKLKGIIDQVAIYPNEAVPSELKTGSAPMRGIWPGHKLQIGAYMLMLETKGYNVSEGFVKYLDLNESRQVLMNPFLKKDIFTKRDAVIELLESKDLPTICENKNKCASCSLKKWCYDEKYMKGKMKVL
ncbi:MAG: Dna2/Cas4 domain-containing protein [archaeon]